MKYSEVIRIRAREQKLIYRFKNVNTYPMLCLNGCRIDKIKYNDSYINLVLKDGFLKKSGDRTRDAFLSVEGGDEVVQVFLTEVIPKEGQPPVYKTRHLDIDVFIKMLSKCEVEIQEEYHSANRIVLRGEIYRPPKLLELSHHLHLFELQFRSKKDITMYYYFNDN